MTRSLSVFLLFGLFLTTLQPVIAKPSFALEQDKVYERVMKTKTIRCGYSDWAPFLVIDPNTNEITGAMKDVMEEIGKRLDVKIEWTAVLGWGDITTAANTDKIDLFCNTVWTDKAQLQNMSLSRPVYYSPTYAFARADDKRFDKNYDAINDPNVRIVGIDGDTGYITMQKYFPKATMIALPSNAQTSEMPVNLQTKKADIFLSDISFADEYTKKNPGQIRRVPGKPLFIMNEVFVTRAGEQQLMNVLDTVLISMINDGFIAKTLKDYGVTASFAPEPDVKLPENLQ